MKINYTKNYIKALKNPPQKLQESFKEELKFLKGYLDSHSLVLDIGCGIGRPALDLATFVKKIIGIDIEKKIINYARMEVKGLINIEFLIGNAFKINFPNKTFDLVYSTYNFLGWDIRKEYRQEIVNEMARVTKPNGKVINITWKTDYKTTQFLKNYYPSIGIKIIKIDNSKILTQKSICDRISKEEFLELYKSAKLNQTSFYDVGPVWLAAVGTK